MTEEVDIDEVLETVRRENKEIEKGWRREKCREYICGGEL